MSIVNTSLVDAREAFNENGTDTTSNQNSIIHQGKFILYALILLFMYL